MPRCPKKCPSSSLRPALMPRVVLSSVQLSCSCNSVHVCTQDTCADSESCLQSSAGPGPEFCPHGLAPPEDDCMGPCRDTPAPPPPCPVCAQHLADSQAFELDRPAGKLYQPITQPYNQPAQGPVYHNSFQSPMQPMLYSQTRPDPVYGTPFPPQMQPYNQPAQNTGCGAPYQPQMPPAPAYNPSAQNSACFTPVQAPPQPYNQPGQNMGCGAPYQPQIPPAPAYNPPAQNPACCTPVQAPPPVCCTTPKAKPAQENQSTNTSATGSYCSMSCGTLKKITATDGDHDQTKSEKESSWTHEEEPEEESSCCKSGSGSGRHATPHMGPNRRRSVDFGLSSSKRRPSLVHIEKGREPRLSLQEPLDKNSRQNDRSQRGASLFPDPEAPCMCRMPPAFGGFCTGNLSGNCNCAECNKK